MTLFSALDLVPLVSGGTSAQSFRDSVELARTLDGLGYERLWYAEHHNMPGIATTQPAILIAHVGQVTKRIRLGAGGVMLPNHAPLQVAETYRMLEALHPGRIDLGIGRAPGTDQVTALALRRSREALRADDFVDQFAELLAFDEDGFPEGHPFASIRAMPDDTRLPPIWLLGSSDYSAKMAAKLGYGFAFAGHFSAEAPEGPLRLYREGFRPGALEKPHAILALSVFCAETEKEARAMASSMLLSFVQLRSGKPGRLPSPEVAMAHAFTPQEEGIASFFRRLAVVGTPDVVKAGVEGRVRSSGADEVMIATHAFDAHARRRSFELVARALS